MKFLPIVLGLSLLPWNAGQAEAIGTYTAGCVAQAEALPGDGEGYQVIRLSRQRYYGHPEMVNYVRQLAAQVWQQGLGVLLIGDMSLPAGGPMPSGHSSHQMGLDADILFQQVPESREQVLSVAEREKLAPISMVNPDGETLDSSRWQPAHGQILQLAAQHPQVTRIFVNAAIKRHLCQAYPGADWLGKIRPWWGHDGHFHVRLECPPDSPLCQRQAPVPAGDGCDSGLDWWFSAEALAPKPKPKEEAPKRPRLPPQCAALLAANP